MKHRPARPRPWRPWWLSSRVEVVLWVAAIVVALVALVSIGVQLLHRHERAAYCAAQGETWQDGRWLDQETYMPGQCVDPGLHA